MTWSFRIALFTAAAALLGVAPAWAQLDGPVDFTTSFPFTVGTRTLPAGHYEIRPLDEETGVMVIAGDKTSAVFSVEPVTLAAVPQQTEVVFDEHGGKYTLETVRVEGESEVAAAEPQQNAQLAANTAKHEQHVAATHKHHARKPHAKSPTT